MVDDATDARPLALHAPRHTGARQQLFDWAFLLVTSYSAIRRHVLSHASLRLANTPTTLIDESLAAHKCVTRPPLAAACTHAAMRRLSRAHRRCAAERSDRFMARTHVKCISQPTPSKSYRLISLANYGYTWIKFDKWNCL